MAPADQQTVNVVFANLGKALAAYERQIKPLPVALDAYAGGNLTALTDDQKDGLLWFFDVGCAQCHHGPLLNDSSFHANYFPTGRQDGAADPGMATGAAELLASEFRGDSIYSDDPAAATWLSHFQPNYLLQGHFKTQSLRGVADTAPYTHGGQEANLTNLVQLYATGGLPDGDELTQGDRDMAIVRFNKNDPRNALLVEFLQTFKGLISIPH
jgi:cytochrome c peroxidase